MPKRCYYCERSFNQTTRRPTRDHIVPRSKNGSDQSLNIRYACADCNTLKSDMLPDVFLEFVRDLITRRRRYKDYTREMMLAVAINTVHLVHHVKEHGRKLYAKRPRIPGKTKEVQEPVPKPPPKTYDFPTIREINKMARKNPGGDAHLRVNNN